MSTNTFKRKLDGVVVSVKNENTVVVNVARRFKHPVYSKFVTKTKKYHAHNVSLEANLGDNVTIIESKPYSKLKKWELLKVNK
ncbi:30S ribosomal protein S17 [Halobacteriovorax sp. GFR7]|uniref:30S ribosomal protein S17 n=1 Tax=Bacteriovoracales TaxID=2024979 RepID=UPI000386CF4D|nr:MULTISPECIES: 30S ribosomal protein S17 [Bacteriovoracales]EPZ52386.1 30S ribosomal protein S17 [Bacteriovorax sp. BAL6_X]POB12396.1 30S ribosomal protein S17 [Halobacteriovorax sp. DA5]